ncbi:MAG: hypothetical protein ACYS0E_20900 [Planctomycetota bacterium]
MRWLVVVLSGVILLLIYGWSQPDTARRTRAAPQGQPPKLDSTALAAQPHPELRIESVEPAKRACELEVLVTLPNGSPAAGARVEWSLASLGRIGRARTNESGLVRIESAATGRYDLRVKHHFWSEEIPGLTGHVGDPRYPRFEGGRAFELADGQRVRHELRLRERLHSFLQLLCTDADGRPIAGMSASMEQRSTTRRERSDCTRSDKNGQLLVIVSAAAPGSRLPFILFRGGLGGGWTKRVELETTAYGAGGPVRIVVPAPIQRTIQVHTPDRRAIPGARVAVTPTHVDGGFAAALKGGSYHKTDARGRVRVPVQSGQTYRVLVVVKGHQKEEQWSWRPPPRDEPTTITMRHALLLRGRVLDERGKGTSNGRIVIRGSAHDEFPIKEDGTFDLRDLSRGTYTVQFIDGHQRLRAQVACDLQADTDIGALRAHPLQRVHGTVVDGSGHPVQQAHVFVRPGSGGCLTDAEGKFALETAVFDAVWLIVRKHRLATRWIHSRSIPERVVMPRPATLEILSGPELQGAVTVRYGPAGAPRLSAFVHLPGAKLHDLPPGELQIDMPFAGPRKAQMREGETTRVAVGDPR